MNQRITLSEEARSAVTETIRTNPAPSHQRIAEQYSVSPWTVYSIAKRAVIRRRRSGAAKAYGKETS